MSETLPDWWMCPVCGQTAQDAGRDADWRCETGHEMASMKPIRLASEDWLKCHNGDALSEMLGAAVDAGVYTAPLVPVTLDKSEAFIRCILGNPFDPFVPSPELLAWRDGTVRRVAESVACDECVDGDIGCPECEGAGFHYDPPFSLRRFPCPNCHEGLLPGRCQKCGGDGLDQSQFPILADALEEANCAHTHTLAHLRQPGEHTPQCHVLRALLEGK